MQKWNIANRINRYYDATLVIGKLENIDTDKSIKIRKTTISKNDYSPFQPLPDTFRVAIIDFEGKPVFMCGILIQNTIFTYYIEDPSHKIDLYKLILKVVHIAEDLWFYAFSDHERIELLWMLMFLQVQGQDISGYEFIKKFPIINLQRVNSKYESLTEAVYSINPKSPQTTGDSLFRNNKLVDQLFRAHKFDEIISHNRNCLLNEALLFMKRWYKNYNL